MKKILIPTLHYPPVIGGFEIFTKNICEELQNESDLEIFVLTGKVHGQPRTEDKGNLHIYRDSSLYPLKDLSYSSYIYILTMLPVLFLRSWFLIYQKGIQVLHAQGYFSGLLCLMLHAVTRRPFIITIQSADFTIYHSEVKFNWLIRLQAWSEKQIYKHATVAHAVSNDLSKHFANQGRPNSVMIPNGVETKIFQPLSFEEKEKMRQKLGIKTKFLVSCLSRLQEKNGTHDLIAAMKVLRDKRTDVSCVIIGDGVERVRLEKMVTEFNLRDTVIFVGDIEHAEVSPYIACSDVFVRPSLAEGFGIVYLEAMACGVPAIGTPVGGIVDFIEPGKTGLLCKVSDPNDLAAKIEQLLNNPTLTQSIVKESFQMIAERYSWKAIAERIKKLYLEVR